MNQFATTSLYNINPKPQINIIKMYVSPTKVGISWHVIIVY